MKKCVLVLSVLGMASAASAEGYFGIYTLGAQYTFDSGNLATRLGVGLPISFGGVFAFGGNAALIFPGSNLSSDGAWKSRFGLGTDVLVLGAYGGGGGALIRPNALGIIEYNYPNGVSVFGEANIGPAFVVGGGGGGLLGYAIPGFKLGLNFR